MIKAFIPSAITLGNLSCGILAILSEDLRLGVLLILIGGFLDLFDGMAARMLNVSSKLGGELDSLADVITFGTAPAILFYRSFWSDGGNLALLIPIIIVCGGAYRLARFNVTESSSNYFEGLAIPSTGIFLGGIITANYYADPWVDLLNNNLPALIIIAALCALANVSKIHMFSFKQFGKSNIVKAYFAIILVSIILIALFKPYIVIASAIVIYSIVAIIDHYIIHTEQKIYPSK